MSIKYRKGFKYQLAEDYEKQVMVFPRETIVTKYVNLTVSGLLTIKSGYAWDEPSGPTVDTANSMRGSLVHDALYELMRKELIPQMWRQQADIALLDIVREDGMGSIRSYWWWREVKKWAAKAASPQSRKKVISAP